VRAARAGLGDGHRLHAARSHGRGDRSRLSVRLRYLLFGLAGEPEFEAGRARLDELRIPHGAIDDYCYGLRIILGGSRGIALAFIYPPRKRDKPAIDFGSVDDELRGAIRESFLAGLPDDAVAALVEGAVRVEAPAGTWIRFNPRLSPTVRMVADGLLRIVRSVPDGRTITQRYMRRGEVGGIAGAFIAPYTRNTGRCDALMHSVFYEFNNEIWRATAERDARVAVALLTELGRIAELSMEHMANRALASMRQRVVGQLLDAADYQDGLDPIVPVTQQQLAEGVGSSREVVARVLHALREEHLIATKVGSVVLLEPERLRSELSVP
jgi:CRP/FNR family transcriptional regulator, cyclic AMP receptor protein